MGLGGPNGVLETEPGFTLCKTNALPAVPFFWPENLFHMETVTVDVLFMGP